MKYASGFCFISPTSLMYQLDLKLGTTHLALAHLVDQNDSYANWFRDRPINHFVIMDNGAFELGESYAPDKLIELGIKCEANAIVLPDYPDQPYQKTIEAAELYANKFYNQGFQTMMVPQSLVGDFTGWLECYKAASTMDNIDIIGMSILGIPNAIPHIDRTYARVVITEYLQRIGVFNYDKHHHYLGLNTGPKLEIPSLLRMNALDTCDSSGPVWHGIHGIAYDDMTDSYMQCSKIRKPVDFELVDIDSPAINTAVHNIEMTNKLFLARS